MKKDLSGIKFGRLIAIKPCGKNKQGNTLWLCKCDCGGETIAINSNLTRGNSKSCGCIKREKTIKRNTKYVHSKHPLYAVWMGMFGRCYTKSSSIYKHYGGKGIEICAKWHDYESFYQWGIASGYEKGLTIERKNYNGNYCPENCEWTTMLRQANNRSDNKIVTAFGFTASLADVCRKFNADYKLTWKRLWRGWNTEKALTTERR